MSYGTDVDLEAVAHWANTQLGTIDHERRVARIAGALFDLTQAHHGLSRPWRRVLLAAALVHDVGRCVDKADHPFRGAKLILRDGRLALREAVRRALAFLTLYHRDEVPEEGDEAYLLESDDRGALRKILALLRAADALDSRSCESPRLVMRMRRERLRITCYLQRPRPKVCRVYQRRKKFRMLKRELGCSVDVAVREARGALPR